MSVMSVMSVMSASFQEQDAQLEASWASLVTSIEATGVDITAFYDKLTQTVILNRILTPPALRGGGLAGAAMRRMTKWADENRTPIALVGTSELTRQGLLVGTVIWDL